VISEAFLFEAVPLVERLKNRGIQIGVATSLTAQEWEAARIYPECRNSGLMRLRPDQVSALVLFGGSSLGRTASMSKSQSAT
jgi:hypothetical protein